MSIDPERDGELRRLAMQIASQFPADPREAMQTLNHCRHLLEDFLGEPQASVSVVRLVDPAS